MKTNYKMYLFILIIVLTGFDPITLFSSTIAFYSPQENNTYLIRGMILLNPVTHGETFFEVSSGAINSLERSSIGDQLVVTASRTDSISPSIISLYYLAEKNQSTLVQTSQRPQEFAWSPTGEYIAYTIPNSSHSFENTIFTVHLDSKEQTQILPENLTGYDLNWSPSGERIAFVGRESGNEDLSNDIYIVELATHEVTNLTQSQADDYLPDWSLSGEQIVFVSKHEQDAQIYLMTSDGSEVERLSNHIGEASAPRWVLGGTHVVYIIIENQYSSFYLLDLETRLTNAIFDRHSISEFDISPDGQQIAYISSDMGSVAELCVFDLVELNNWCSETRPIPSSAVDWK